MRSADCDNSEMIRTVRNFIENSGEEKSLLKFDAVSLKKIKYVVKFWMGQAVVKAQEGTGDSENVSGSLAQAAIRPQCAS